MSLPYAGKDGLARVVARLKYEGSTFWGPAVKRSFKRLAVAALGWPVSLAKGRFREAWQRLSDVPHAFVDLYSEPRDDAYYFSAHLAALMLPFKIWFVLDWLGRVGAQ